MKNNIKYHEPFSPVIMESKVPDKFLKLINDVGDDVLSDEVKSREWDWSGQLVGKVHKEIQIPVRNNDDKEFLMQVMKGGCVDYLKESIKSNTALCKKRSIKFPNAPPIMRLKAK